MIEEKRIAESVSFVSSLLERKNCIFCVLVVIHQGKPFKTVWYANKSGEQYTDTNKYMDAEYNNKQIKVQSCSKE